MMIKCPTTGRALRTGVETDENSFSRLPDVLAHSVCPHCGLRHSWWTREAWLCDEAPIAPAAGSR